MKQIPGTLQRWSRRLGATLVLALVAAGPSARAAPSGPVAAIRVLIDVSGSMRRTDPHRLRAPALRLLARLLPDGARAGVWTFATRPVERVAPARVDRAWRARAARAAAAIDSRGLHTDIESALAAALQGWSRPDPRERRIIVLLTDGKIDLGRGAARDAASRRAVLGPTLAHIRAAGAAVFGIALSNDADKALLQRLAEGSGGRFFATDDARRLERIFARIFVQSVRPQTLPIAGNRFLVDPSVKEFTVLVFHPPGAATAALRAPDGKLLSPRRPGSLWKEGADYDLVTVAHPQSGTWRLEAPPDRDNRVMVLTDLRLRSTASPATAVPGTALTLSARLLDHDRPVDSPRVLRLLSVHARYQLPGAAPAVITLLDDGRNGDRTAGDGVFTARLPPAERAGAVTVRLVVDGQTFRREQNDDLRVAWPVRERIVPAGSHGALQLQIVPDPRLVVPATLRPAAEVDSPGGQASPLVFTTGAGGILQARIPAAAPGARRSLSLHVDARTPAGEPVSVQMPSLPVRGGADAALAPAPRAPVSTPAPSVPVAVTREATSTPAARTRPAHVTPSVPSPAPRRPVPHPAPPAAARTAPKPAAPIGPLAVLGIALALALGSLAAGALLRASARRQSARMPALFEP